ncbi:MAG: mechanosensitive ion channel family protein [Acidobacteriaceae bacterium]|nr:mechanosensitive ion channel family protein [Acidobacteriaceae bacterium]
MTRKFYLTLILFSVFVPTYGAPATAPADPLNRLNPRSTVTAFLQACHQHDYDKAAQYLDLSHISPRRQPEEGPALARDLESLLNSASRFDVLRLSQDPQGNLGDDPDPTIEHVTEVSSNDQQFTIELHRNETAKGPAIWLFSASTVAKIPQLMPVSSTESQIEARLPRFLVTKELLETPLWKWIALLMIGFVLFAVFRMLVHLFNSLLRSLATRIKRTGAIAWIRAIIDPLLVLLTVILFRILEEAITPAALMRLYIGRVLLLVIVYSFAWGLTNLLDSLIVRFDRTLNQRQRIVSRSIVYLGRRTLKTVIWIFAVTLVLDNWGFNMTTVIAGLGVGGIAIALAAQQTIANVFGGVSVVGDAPVMVGDFGSFGGVVGTVEDIGLRSTRVRTLNRTIMSIPNSAFAGMNLENYAVRDKILYNPTFAIKRATPKEQIRRLVQGLREVLEKDKMIEIGPSPVRISAYSAASFTVEIFSYVLTADIDEFYKHQAELYLAIDEVVASTGVELA